MACEVKSKSIDEFI